MPSNASVTCRILSEDRALFEGGAARIELPAVGGMMTVFPGHAETFGILLAGTCVVVPPGGSPQRLEIAGGNFHVRGDAFVATVELAEPQRPDRGASTPETASAAKSA